MQQSTSSLWLRRLLVIALYASFLICLLTIWLSGTLFGDPAQVLQPWLLQMIDVYRTFMLIASALLLLVFYSLLRHTTGEIMVMPERYLDERQKVIRDQAHRSAFTFVKFACCLIPALLFIQHFLLKQSAITVYPMLQVVAPRISGNSVIVSSINPLPSSGFVLTQGAGNVLRHVTVWAPQPAILQASPLEIALAAIVLLLCLLLLISALPMSVLAWKKRI